MIVTFIGNYLDTNWSLDIHNVHARDGSVSHTFILDVLGLNYVHTSYACVDKGLERISGHVPKYHEPFGFVVNFLFA